MYDYIIMMSSVVYKLITANTEHEMKASKYYLVSITTTSIQDKSCSGIYSNWSDIQCNNTDNLSDNCQINA